MVSLRSKFILRKIDIYCKKRLLKNINGIIEFDILTNLCYYI